MNVQSQASQFHIYTQAVKSPLSRADIACMRMHLRSVALNILLPSQIHSSIPPAMPCSIAMLKFYANSNRTYWQMSGLCTSSKLIPLETHAAGIWASSDSPLEISSGQLQGTALVPCTWNLLQAHKDQQHQYHAGAVSPVMPAAGVRASSKADLMACFRRPVRCLSCTSCSWATLAASSASCTSCIGRIPFPVMLPYILDSPGLSNSRAVKRMRAWFSTHLHHRWQLPDMRSGERQNSFI